MECNENAIVCRPVAPMPSRGHDGADSRAQRPLEDDMIDFDEGNESIAYRL